MHVQFLLNYFILQKLGRNIQEHSLFPQYEATCTLCLIGLCVSSIEYSYGSQGFAYVECRFAHAHPLFCSKNSSIYFQAIAHLEKHFMTVLLPYSLLLTLTHGLQTSHLSWEKQFSLGVSVIIWMSLFIFPGQTLKRFMG